MRIAHFSDSIWAKGGMATYIRLVSDEQRNRGHEILFADNAKNESVNSGGPPPIYVNSTFDIWKAARENAVDVLHLHCHVEWDSVIEKAIRDEFGTISPKVIRTVHNHEPYCPSGTRLLLNRGRACDRSYNFMRCVWGHCIDRCGSIRPEKISFNFKRVKSNLRQLPGIQSVTVSEYLRTQMALSGYDAGSIRTIKLPTSGCPEYCPPPREGKPHFVFLGRLAPQKGVAWLLRAAAACKSEIHLDIAGEGLSFGELSKLSKELGLEKKVTFHGWLDSTRSAALIGQSRAVVFPSVWPEPAGFISLEAGLFGRAVIGSRLGAIPEYIGDHETGLLVTPSSVGDLAAAIDALANDYDLATEMGLNGRQRVRDNHSLADHCDRLEEVYRLGN